MLDAWGIVKDLSLYALTIVYWLALLALAFYSVNFFHLMIVACQHRHDKKEAPDLAAYPAVTVQLPIYNERHVAGRVIDAACRLDWPRERLEIQVLDDSTDETREIVASAVARWRTAGAHIVHIHRSRRAGYKAGALSEGLAVAKGELVAIFDADFVPPPHFLRCAVPHFAQDDRLGFVQARWGHLNRDASLLTMLQSLSIDGHFMVEQFARTQSGYVMNFNGTAGVWRRSAILDAGGWNAGTLTEDLDLSYRAALRGWRSRLLPDLVAPAELVTEISAYRRQQTRWAQGSIECAVRLLPQIWRSHVPLETKIQGALHLTGYAIQVLMLIISLIYPLIVIKALHGPLLQAVYGISALLAPLALAPTLFFTYAQYALDRKGWWKRIPYLMCLTVLGSGMALNSARAIARGLRGRLAVFERTPKSGQVGRSRAVSRQSYTLPFDPIVFGEIWLCLFNLNTARLALHAESWGILMYSLIFAAGLAYVAGQSLWLHRDALLRGARAAWLPATAPAKKTCGALPDAARDMIREYPR